MTILSSETTMKKLFMWVAGAMLSAGLMASAGAAGTGTKEEAAEMLKKAVAYYKANGKDKAFAEFNNKSGQFVDRDLYVYVLDTTGHIKAHGTNPRLIGKDLMQLKDADGKLFIVDIVEMIKAQKSGWIDYKWTNPVTKQIEQKTTLVEPVGDIGLAVGVYK